MYQPIALWQSRSQRSDPLLDDVLRVIVLSRTRRVLSSLLSDVKNGFAHAAEISLSKIAGQFVAVSRRFFLRQFLRLPLQKEIEIAAHH